jgi:hypothetical protein
MTPDTGSVTPSAGYRVCSGKTSVAGECKAAVPGVYAVKTELDVWWRDEVSSPTIYDPGRGKIVVYSREEIDDLCEDGSNGTATVQVCGVVMPTVLADANCGALQVVFPDKLWDGPAMPSFMTSAMSGFAAGEMWTTSKVFSLLGIELVAADSAWPAYTEVTTFSCPAGKGAQCFPDHDGDSSPGITVTMKLDGSPGQQAYSCIAPWEYMTYPLSALGALDKSAGASDLFIGLRARIGSSATFASSCTLTPANAAADRWESRLIDCKLKNGTKCASGEANFADQTLPRYYLLAAGAVPPAEWKHPRSEADAALSRASSAGPISSVVRLGDNDASANCARIRSTTFP